jgi:hypothetical protein
MLVITCDYCCHVLCPTVDERDAEELRREMEAILITAEECQVGGE